MADVRWFRMDSNEDMKEWKTPLTPLQRYAWLLLLQHVASTAPSQKRPGIAPALPLERAARIWEIPREDIEEMIAHAKLAGELNTSDGSWEVTNKAHFVSERSLKDKHNEQDGAQEDSATFCTVLQKNAEKSGKTRKNPAALSRDPHPNTNNYISNSSLSDEQAEGTPKPKRTWATVADEMIAGMPHHDPTVIRLWCDYAKQKRLSLPLPISVKQTIEDLLPWSSERLRIAVKFSIGKSYKSIWEPKGSDQPKPKPQPVYAEPEEAI